MLTKRKFWATDMSCQIGVRFYEPEKVPFVAKIMIAHDLGENGSKYEKFAEYMNSKRIVVVIMDLPGHGESVNARGKPMYWYKGQWDKIVSDFMTLNFMLGEMYPELPCIMMGVGFGTWIVRDCLTREFKDCNRVDGTILVSPSNYSRFKSKMYLRYIDRLLKKTEDAEISEYFTQKIFNYGNKLLPKNKEKSDYAWLFDEEEARKAYVEDESVYKFVTFGMAREIFQAMYDLRSNETFASTNCEVPMFVVYGRYDPLITSSTGDTSQDLEEEFGFHKGKKDKRTNLIVYPFYSSRAVMYTSDTSLLYRMILYFVDSYAKYERNYQRE